MAEGKTDPFAIIDQLSVARAATNVAKGKEAVGTDSMREQRDAERRERLGQLRAREHPAGRKNNRIHQLFG